MPQHLSIEHRNKISLGLIGRPVSLETRDRLSNSHKTSPKSISAREQLHKSNIGKKRSLSVRQKMRDRKLGVKRKPFSLETRTKIALYHTGKPLSEQTKSKISYHNTGEKHPNFGKPRKPETIQKIKNARRKQILPQKDTKPERIMQIALSLEGVIFSKHKPILGQPDIFIEPNICIFVDGDYWHNRPNVKERDEFVTKSLISQGYKVIRMWEHDVYSDAKQCVNNILNLINM